MRLLVSVNDGALAAVGVNGTVAITAAAAAAADVSAAVTDAAEVGFIDCSLVNSVAACVSAEMKLRFR